VQDVPQANRQLGILTSASDSETELVYLQKSSSPAFDQSQNNLLNPTSLHTLSTTPLKLLCSTFTIILLML